MNMNSNINAGFMTKKEKECFESIGQTNINLFWVPGHWFVYNLSRAQEMGRVTDDFGVQLIMKVSMFMFQALKQVPEFNVN